MQHQTEATQLTIAAASDIKIKTTIKRLHQAKQVFPHCRAILFTSKQISEATGEIEIIRINPLDSLRAYSDFIIYSLHHYIDSTHVLIVQWDGFIVNPNRWDQEFLNYDYIGAPFIPRSNNWGYSRDANGGFYAVGNGGFTLRSKRLLAAPTQLGLLDDVQLTNHHEDGFFCVLHRTTLEQQGFQWAPTASAFRFAIESPLERRHLLLPSFGIHGRRALSLYRLGVCHLASHLVREDGKRKYQED